MKAKFDKIMATFVEEQNQKAHMNNNHGAGKAGGHGSITSLVTHSQTPSNFILNQAKYGSSKY
jgi:hypothetical protein